MTLSKAPSLHPHGTSCAFLVSILVLLLECDAFVNTVVKPPVGFRVRLWNSYDDWRSDAVAPTMPLDQENVHWCLQEMIDSDYGKQMFGIHDLPAAHQITGMLEFVELEGPLVMVRMTGQFWHRRETVLGRAATWFHACMPEITEVQVESIEQLEDFEEIRDELTGELLGRLDKRSVDFNGDRETMEYQGINPDVRGPFPPGVGVLRPGGSMINPA